ncbi:MAG: hypothetical protein ACM3VV_06520 [Deltaproteobacteria bacterium]|jgi:hypothetical protein|nr:hypothetical protein [Nitrososphaeraceae archaeon]
MNNTIKGETCYYATYAKIKGNPTEKECSKPATRHIENETTSQQFPVCEEHYQKVSKRLES